MNNNTAPLAADSYFFKELISGDVQTTEQAFGPVTGDERTKYRVTSKFTVTSEMKAYAICTGQVFLQPHSDASKLNLILRPYRQPIRGVAIKYFIYRGLKKTDFIPTGNTFLVGHNQLSSASEFIQLIWNQLKSFNDWTDTQANNNDFRAEWIGYKPADQPDDSLIDDYFFLADAYGDENNETLKPFELPMVPKGTQLGNFTGDYGLDVVLSEGDYKPLRSNTGFQFDLAYARAAEAIIDTAQVPSGYAEKQYREAITWFMDAAAYYGLHFSKKGKVLAKNGSNEEKKERQQLYDDIITKFANKNKVYIHLQGHLGRSYNYYGSYSDLVENDEVLKLGVGEDAITATTYPENGWPVIIQENSQEHTEGANSIFLQLAHDQTNTLLAYAQIGLLSNKAENNFLTEIQLRPQTTVDQDGNTVVDNYCNPIEIVVPAVGEPTSKLNVTGYVKLLYLGNELTATEDVNGTPEERVVKPIDTIFGPINIEQRLASANTDVIAWSFSHTQHLVAVSQIEENKDTFLAVQTKTISDKLAFGESENLLIQERIIYETLLIQGIGRGVLNRSNGITSSPNAGNIPYSQENNNFYLPSLPYYLATENFTDETTNINGIRLNQLNNEPINQFFLGITSGEQNQLKTEASNSNILSATIFLEPLAGSSHFVSQEGKEYNKYYLKVIGEKLSGSLELLTPAALTKIYTMDYKCFFSQQFVEEMPELLPPNIRDTIISNFNQY